MELARIAKMTESADSFELLLGPDVPTRDYKSGETIFREGDRGAEFYVVQRGRVRILTGNRLLETLGENEIFGEMALIDASLRSASAIAETDVTVAPIAGRHAPSLLRPTPVSAPTAS